ncbi:MAG: DUF4143 domain-containing protein [Verrucomicrobiota bacterium]|nr:DUF4143 domain-containing protein [Verrucomicrobiota bacterium]
MTLYPMSFLEFLHATNESLIADKLSSNKELIPFNVAIHDKLLKLLTDYLYVGGMPEAVQSYADNNNIFQARKIQVEILKAYERDFSKYVTKTEAMKNLSIWNSIPLQLAKENKKFLCSKVKKGTRFATYENSFEWLENAGLINVVRNVKTPKLPLGGYSDTYKFKIYLLDTGLLGAMLESEPSTIINSQLFSEYKGAFIENYVAMELKNCGFEKIFYWTSKSDAEVDFVLRVDNNILPIEVKSGMDRNIKSLRSYYDKYKPEHIIRLSPRNFDKNGEFLNIALYAPFLIKQVK